MRTGYQHIVLDYLVDRVKAVRKERTARLQSIRTRKDAEKYQEEVRRVIGKAFSPMPPRTPLNAVVTGVVKRPTHCIEKIVFESRPQFLVTANLYLPNNLRGPTPAILGSCGHSQDGKALPTYQGFCQRLVQSGFIVLLFDPISQGERDQHYHLPPKAYIRRSCVTAHNMLGKQLELIGEFFGAWRAWDAIRALDYLLTRPEVDASRVGMTGNSGGGTMTTWLWPLEPRIKMAAPSCFLSPFLHNLENEMPQDAEQYPPGILGQGVDLADFFLARAPDPVLLLGQKYDYFDRRGFAEICAETRRFYRFFGAERNVHSFLGSNIHGYFPDAQEKMVGFFCNQSGVTRPKKKPVVKPEKDKVLFATPKGQVVPAGSKPAYRIMAEKANSLAATRRKLSGAELKKTLQRLLRLPARESRPHYRVLRPYPLYAPQVARYAVETEKNIRVILTKVLKETSQAGTLDVEKEVHLHLPHFSSEEEIAREPLAKKLIQRHPLYLLDVRGLGESVPDEEHGFFQHYGKDYMFHGFFLLLGESYLGRRVHDVLSVIDLLVGEGARHVHLHGRGQGALIALFAALLHPNVKGTTLKNLPLSFRDWVRTPVVKWPAANVVRGILKEMEIADCLRALGAKVKLLEAWGADMEPVKTSLGQRTCKH